MHGYGLAAAVTTSAYSANCYGRQVAAMLGCILTVDKVFSTAFVMGSLVVNNAFNRFLKANIVELHTAERYKRRWRCWVSRRRAED